MNAKRRQKLREVLRELGKTHSDIKSILDEEDDARDNMPEGLQDSDKYVASEEASEAMEDAVDSISDAMTGIERALSN